MFRFASLGSGSEGNALIVQKGQTTLMIDCGFGVRESARRLERLGLDGSNISAVVVTHEHSDHVGGAPAFARKFGMPVWLTFGTYSATASKWDGVQVKHFDSHDAFAIDALEVHPFPVPHDAREPAQMVLTDGSHRLGVLTDVGETTAHIEENLSHCDALFLEANHCPDLLRKSAYPARLKARIAGRFGHLSNAESAALLGRVMSPRLGVVVAAHLSQQNNRAELAREAFAQVLGWQADRIQVATQAEGSPWTAVRAL